MTSSKESIARIVLILKNKGVNKVVFSPGSRNAPLVIAFAEDPFFECLNIPDERVAAFFAMGLALKSKSPVAICSTSGSACLNYAPAIAEAFYQGIPLIVLTADRPIERIDMGEGQSMRQVDVFRNYIKTSVSLRQEAVSRKDLWYNDRLVNRATNSALDGKPGPVHINIPLEEPLYETKESVGSPKVVHRFDGSNSLNSETYAQLAISLKKHRSIVLLIGQQQINSQLKDLIQTLADQLHVVVLTETTGNVYIRNSVDCIDRTIECLHASNTSEYTPDLLLTIGGAIVSKKIKILLRNMVIKEHWHIAVGEDFPDTYEKLTHRINCDPEEFFEYLKNQPKENISSTAAEQDRSQFKLKWQNLTDRALEQHNRFLHKCDWSDLKVFEHLLKSVPHGSDLHLANSTPIRYAQLFDMRDDLGYFSNRGLSGIDGCTSTALGASYHSDTPVVLITGDMGFFYDSNAFWHNHKNPQSRIIVINNGGGGIFRFIPGPSSTPHLEQHFEATHQASVKGIAMAYDLDYELASSEKELLDALQHFYQPSNKIRVLEITTPRTKNDIILKEYFSQLNNSNMD